MRYLTETDYAAVREMRDEKKMMIKDIAKKFQVCEATISNILKGNRLPRKRVGKALFPAQGIEREEDQDFSTLPDNILFQHVRYYDFIG